MPPERTLSVETPRLRLVRLTADDLSELHALDSDPEVMRYVNGGRPTSRRQLEEERRMVVYELSRPS